MVTLILTLTMCALLFLMIWSATYFYPWTGLLRFFSKDIEEKARLHQPPFPAAPVIGWILMLLCALGFVGVIIYGGWDGVRKGFTFGQFLVRFLVILLGMAWPRRLYAADRKEVKNKNAFPYRVMEKLFLPARG